jgi:hypothetical protein
MTETSRNQDGLAQPARREFLERSTIGTVVWATAGVLRAVPLSAEPPASPAGKKTRIVNAHIGDGIRLPNCSGDVWTTTWADDDHLYSVTDDTTGFNKACNSNLAVQRITGGPPPNIQGDTVNPMAEFGKAAELKEDGASWKASGLTCVDGVLYLAASRHYYDGVGDTSTDSAHHFWIQETWDSGIVKSIDHGKTWSEAPRLGKGMFPGRVFSNPFFVQYGKDGKGDKNGANQYVYAVSNDGTWNNGNWMTLGRVSRGLIERLDAGDWEFVHGFDGKGEPIWRPRHDNALYIFRSPGRASMTGIHYIAPLDLYLMPQWHYPYLDDPKRRWKATRWELYSAPAPWGPWTLFHSQDFEPQGFYNPSIPGKFISEDGRRFWIFVAGDFTAYEQAANFYGLNMVPVTLEVEAS